MNEIQVEVLERLDSLAVALKTTSEHVYTILVQQALVSSISHLVSLVIGVVISIIFYKALPPAKESFEGDGFASGIYWVGYILWCIFLMTLSLSNMNNMITGFINPEYIAIKEIMRVFQ